MSDPLSLIRRAEFERLVARVKILEQKGHANMSKLDSLEKEVAEMGTVVESAIVLINGFRDQLLECGVDKEKLEAFALELDARANALAAAVAGPGGGSTGGISEKPDEEGQTP